MLPHTKKIRLLVLGHSYLTPFAQGKYVAIKKLDPELELRLVTPPTSRHPFKTYHQSRHPELKTQETTVLPTVMGRTHMTYLFNPVRLANAIRLFGPTHIHIEEDPHSFIGVEAALVARVAAPDSTVSYFIWDNLARTPRFPINLAKRYFTRFSLARAKMVVCGNAEAARLLIQVKKYLGRTVVLPQLGIDPTLYVPKIEAAQTNHDIPRIGYIGRLVPEKGLEIFLEALLRLKHLRWELRVVGDGPMREEIQKRWRCEFGERLLFDRAVEHEEVPGELARLDIFVLPSYRTDFWVEQFGLTLAQAMMAGVACIGTRSGAIPEVIGEGGLVVPERDSQALANALEKLICQPEMRKQLGDTARAIALENYSHSSLARKYLDVFQGISQ